MSDGLDHIRRAVRARYSAAELRPCGMLYVVEDAGGRRLGHPKGTASRAWRSALEFIEANRP